MKTLRILSRPCTVPAALRPAAFVLALLCGGATQAAETLVFSSVDKSAVDDIGFLVLQEAYARLGQPITRETFPAERALVLSSGGRNDGVVVRMPGIEQEYPDLVMVPVILCREDGLVFTRHVALEVRGWDSLAPYRLGIRRGIKFIEKGTAGMQVLSGTTNEQLFDMLASDRVQLLVLPRLLGMTTLREANHPQVRALEPPVGSVELYHYLHRRRAALLPAITEVLQDMARAGRMEAIRQEFLARTAAP